TILLQGNAYFPERTDLEVWITQEVIDEIKSRIPRMRLEQALNSNHVHVRIPSQKSLKRARTAATKSGDLQNLSDADLSVIALALDGRDMGMNLLVYTDDYSIQNTLKILNVKFRSSTTQGISRVIRWMYVCQACKATFKVLPPRNECPECGTDGMIKKVKMR
ncbi:MAG: NOB1 family endonuclease, partial [Promethearchaeota archaeon]